MLIVGLALAALAALVHVYIFYLESVAWTGTKARAIFGTTADEARITQTLAFNQGFYNLFLAITIGVGIVIALMGQTAIGATLVFVGTSSMVAAALVLFASSPRKWSAALTQGLVPLLAIIAMAIGLATE